MLTINNPDLADLLAGRTGSFTSSQLDAVRARAAEILELPERDAVVGPDRIERFRKTRPGTILASKIDRLTKYIPGLKGGCSRCKNLQEQMDRHGWRWCADNRQILIDQIVNNAAAAHKWIPASLAMMLTDSEAFRAELGKVLDSAIQEAQRLEPRKPSKFFRRSNKMWSVHDSRFISSAQLHEDVKTLVSLLPPDITAVAGVARSGMAVATLVSMYLHLPILTIRQTMNDVVATGNGWRLGGSKHVDPQREKVAVIDDTVMTGNSLKAIAPLLQKEFPNHITATVYCNPHAAQKPDIWAVDLPSPHLLEWNLFNSVFSPNMAWDFDGILCHDCPAGSDDDGPKYLEFIRNAKPLYGPRKVPIPLIVTARIERYRQPTLEWLDRHRIQVHKLVMHPASTLAERQRHDIAAFKAKHFLQWSRSHKMIGPPPLMFVESEDWQAKRIHELTKLTTVCPGSGKMY